MERLKTLFLGTPEIAVPFLERLTQLSDLQAVVTAPDEPSGRGYVVQAPPVKRAAEGLGIPIEQPATLKDPAQVRRLRRYAFDVAVVVAYGKLLPVDVLALGRHGFLNVHFSLLPKYRGAAPIQWALIRGETETGVTLFWLDAGMDTGPVFLQDRIAIAPGDNAETLKRKLVPEGLRLMEEAIARLSRGEKIARPQSGEGLKAPILRKEDGRVNWNRKASEIVNQWRGMFSWPGLHTMISKDGRPARLKILEAAVHPQAGSFLDYGPGQVVAADSRNGVVVRCAEGCLRLLQVQPEGKRAMTGWQFWQGARMKTGDRLG